MRGTRSSGRSTSAQNRPFSAIPPKLSDQDVSPQANTTLLVGDLWLSQEAGPQTYANENITSLAEVKSNWLTF